MNLNIKPIPDSVAAHPQPIPSSNLISGKRSGYTFKKFIDLILTPFSFIFIHVVLRIKHAIEKLFSASVALPPSEITHVVILPSTTHTYEHLFPKHLADNNSQVLVNKNPSLSPPHVPSAIEINEIPVDFEEPLAFEFKEENSDSSGELQSNLTQEMSTLILSVDSPRENHMPTAINVRDDGNCLFYSIAVGLRKKYEAYPDIQAKLNWSFDSKKLIGDLSTSDNLLEAPGKQLRQQAAKYLEENMRDESVLMALMDGIGSHLEVIQKKIQEEEETISYLQEQVKYLQEQQPSQQAEIKALEDNIAGFQKSVTIQKQNLIADTDYESYIHLTKEDYVYCGTAQVVALSKEYNIPIRVIRNYNTDHPYIETFNESINLNRNPPLPILTIVHVNGNHFQFLDD